MSAYVVLVAAGRGERMGPLSGAMGKAFVDIGGETVLRASARRAAACPDVAGIVAVVAEPALAEAAAQLADCEKLRAIVPGGDTRQRSVLCGLAALPPDCDIVLIHDAARAHATPELFARCVAEVRRWGAAIPAVPVTDTVKVVDGNRILRTPDRATLVAVQTPQGFLRADIESAHRRCRDEGFEGTDDASLLEHLGMPVHSFDGEISNHKLTTPEDLRRIGAGNRGGDNRGGDKPSSANDGVRGAHGREDPSGECAEPPGGEPRVGGACAETPGGEPHVGGACADPSGGEPRVGGACAETPGGEPHVGGACADPSGGEPRVGGARSSLCLPRVGQGFDAHRLVPKRRLVLCGVEIPFERGLLGHSDADVALHALMDALLSAAGLDDIGAWFPDSDAAYRDADSMELLRKVMAQVNARGYRLGNADVTLIAQRPKLAAYRGAMRGRLAQGLGVSEAAVNVKFTTTEGMGWTGSGEGIAALAVVMLG